MKNFKVDDRFYRKLEGVPDRLAAGGVVARKNPLKASDPWEVALIKEGFDFWVLPKGGVEKGESLERAARREILEEAGLEDLVLLAPLGSAQRMNSALSHWVVCHYFLFTLHENLKNPEWSNREIPPSYQSERTTDLNWFSMDQAPDLLGWREQADTVTLAQSLLKI